MIRNEGPVLYQTTKKELDKIYKYLIESELLMKFFFKYQLMMLKGYLKQQTNYIIEQ
jgi:hypothetical protein